MMWATIASRWSPAGESLISFTAVCPHCGRDAWWTQVQRRDGTLGSIEINHTPAETVAAGA